MCLSRLWTTPDADPCEVRFVPAEPRHPQGMPASIEVWHGDELFGRFLVDSASLEVTPAAAGKGDVPDQKNGDLPGGGA